MSTSYSNLSSNDSNPRRCAACKYLRRRCAEDCILSPYFPASLPQRFACVHKIFGASNVTRMLQQLPVDQRAQAADAIASEAYWRVQDPVYGSVGVINLLQQEIYMNQRELARTQAQIAMYTAQQQPTEVTNFDPQQDSVALERTFLEFNHFPNLF
ncbi:LOB domain-containing protein 23-like [Typha latifolia]|uniref:LOB domain-containing protein 23-like n=1 Tax=Typha latifolia TaxID=4733 RepID=UPI003C2E7E47